MDIEEERKLFRRSANLTIIRKVADTMGISSEDLHKELNRSRSAVNAMIAAGDEKAGNRWNYNEVAKKMNIDPKIFSGERLFEIGGELIQHIKGNYSVLVRTGSGTNAAKNELLQQRKKYTAEYTLWGAILEEITGITQFGDLKKWREAKRLLLHEVGRQTKSRSFKDEELQKLWYYLNKKYGQK